MIIFLGEKNRMKSARKDVPDTAEFEALRLAQHDPATSELLNSAIVGLDEVVKNCLSQQQSCFCPDDLYANVFAPRERRDRWEEMFNGEENGRLLFGLLAWTYFFHQSDTWLAKPSSTQLGKRSWSFERILTIGQCVYWRVMNLYGRVVDGPRDRNEEIPAREFLVRFPQRLGRPDERWVAERNLYVAEEAYCQGIPR